MGATRMAVVLTAAFALTTVATASATAAGREAAASRTAVDDIVKPVTGLLPTVTSAVPDLGALQQLIACLQAVLQGLIGQLPALPPVTTPAPPKLPGTATSTAAATPQQQLDALRVRVHALTAAARTHPATG
ncbi:MULTISPECIES: hypothetical protein [unclassified Kitasatospora]|uniref:hypothetical protein n=1 Tax=unclassified Kitasatospora TaxID=2633591 RepID=UPI0033C31568